MLPRACDVKRSICTGSLPLIVAKPIKPLMTVVQRAFVRCGALFSARGAVNASVAAKIATDVSTRSIVVSSAIFCSWAIEHVKTEVLASFCNRWDGLSQALTAIRRRLCYWGYHTSTCLRRTNGMAGTDIARRPPTRAAGSGTQFAPGSYLYEVERDEDDGGRCSSVRLSDQSA